ncbi:hypothetical protein OUZ56_005787 [Daphnia magna]|uniref:Uncharacterized protein n=1 Tax=Daphnia magna TaxID=35525 RepID=A0ABQ9YV51_9CRUS|nr:hypothetical protein OUZ56_005787 [Daphnia magna]
MTLWKQPYTNSLHPTIKQKKSLSWCCNSIAYLKNVSCINNYAQKKRLVAIPNVKCTDFRLDERVMKKMKEYSLYYMSLQCIRQQDNSIILHSDCS